VPEIRILPDNIVISAERGRRLLDVLRENNIFVNSLCGGMGWCRKCKVKIKRGNIDRVELACQLFIKDDLTIELLEENVSFRILSDFTLKRNINLDPIIKLEPFSLPPPNLEDQRSDLERILSFNKNIFVKRLDLLRKIPLFLRRNDFKGKFVCYENNEIIDLVEREFEKPYGVAFDIGTNTLVGYLLDLKEGKDIGIITQVNPQVEYGVDILSRVNYIISEKDGIEILREKIIKTLEYMINKLCKRSMVNPKDIYAISVAGNPTMEHIFLGITPQFIAVSPFIPIVDLGMTFDAFEVGFSKSKNAKVYVFPNISGYVGGDIIAGILSTNLWQEEGNVLFVDIGTNSEIVLKSRKGMFACATAAGPAFEGGRITYGMVAKEGAIDRVWVEENKVVYSVIGEKEEKGICGSGIADAISIMLDLGIIDRTGRFVKNEDFALGKIKITQKDMREIQLAKSAIRAGIEILLKEAEITSENIEKIFLAGALGNYLRRESAVKIGLLPSVDIDKIIYVGNSAGMGAEILLLDKNYRELADKIAKEVNYIELSAKKEFQNYFVEYMHF